MPRVQIRGRDDGCGVEVVIDGHSIPEVRSAEFRAPVDGLATFTVEALCEAGFEIDLAAEVNFVVPEGCELITVADGRKRVVRCAQ